MQTANPDDITEVYQPFDYDAFDPMGTSPQLNEAIYQTWDKLLSLTWNNYKIKWDSLPP